MMRRKTTISLDDPKTKRAVELYQSGATFEEVAPAVGLSEITLKRRFKLLGIPARKAGRRRLAEEKIEKIRQEHQSGKSCYQIAKEMGVSAPTVRKYAK